MSFDFEGETTVLPPMNFPETTSGFQSMFNGTYRVQNGANKIAIQKYLTQDLCGQIPDVSESLMIFYIPPFIKKNSQKGILEIQIRPSSASNDSEC